MNTPIFPKWTNLLRPAVGIVAATLPIYLAVLINYGFSPRTTDVGYQPIQPVPYSHALHAGELGIDCRYCHNTVDVAADAAIPPTQTCWNCHHTQGIRADSVLLEPIRQSQASGMPVLWTRVHDLPDYAYFNHSSHVNAGVGCKSCHGRVDKMAVVYQHEPLSMAWCLDCHRNPAPHLRPESVPVTDMLWEAGQESPETQKQLMTDRKINTTILQDCSTCHR